MSSGARDEPDAGPEHAAATGDVRESQSQTIATVERAADVLALFSQVSERDLGVTEIAAQLSLSKAAVHRILTSLRTRDFVQVHEETRRYSLGPAALALGLTYLDRIDVRAVAAPELLALCRETDETATLSIRAGETWFYIDQVTPAREVRMSVALGVPFPLHAGSSSKAFLAFLPLEEQERYLARPTLEALTEHTVVDPAQLRVELAAVRERGVATSFGERQPGAASVAAPVLDHRGLPAAAVSVCGPVERFASEIDDCIPLLLAATRRISARLGHRGDVPVPARTSPPKPARRRPSRAAARVPRA